MKKLVVLLASACAASAFAQTYVRPHVRSDGTYVEGHYRSRPDNSSLNNYSTQGNTNPFTGQQGSVNPYAQPSYGGIQPIRPIQPLQPLQPLAPLAPLGGLQ